MKTNSRLTLAFFLLILMVSQVGADSPPQNGPYVEYYESGKKRLESHYKDGKPDGLWTDWRENGQKRDETHYKNGELDGLSTSWNKDGNKTKEIHYKNGNEVSRTAF